MLKVGSIANLPNVSGHCKDNQVKKHNIENMTKKEIAKAFSNGEFEKTNKFISDTAIWTVVEEDTFIGKKAIIDNCEQVGSYFQSVTTDFKTLNIIAEGNKVVINGTAEFLRDNQRKLRKFKAPHSPSLPDFLGKIPPLTVRDCY